MPFGVVKGACTQKQPERSVPWCSQDVHEYVVTPVDWLNALQGQIQHGQLPGECLL